MTPHIRWPLVLDDMEAEVSGDDMPEYDPADFPGFTSEQIVAGLTVLACGEAE